MSDGYIWQGNLVRLRAVEPDDWETFHEWNLDTEMARGSYEVPFPHSREGERRWAERQAAQPPDGHAFRFVIETLDGEMVGTLNTHSCDPRNGTFSYGVAIGGEHRRKGFAAEAIRLLLGYFFDELRYQKVNAHIFSFNDSSIQLHERLGFQLEGRIRRMVYTQGRFFDDLVYGLTVEEFRATGEAGG